MPRAALILLLLLLAACDRRPETPPKETAKHEAIVATQAQTARAIVFFGDSLTAGLGVDPSEAFPSILEARLKREERPWRVVNAGVSGDTTAGGVARLDWVYRTKADVLVLELGANDGLRGIPPAETEKNLRLILQRAVKERSTILLVGMQMPENYGSAHRSRFADLYPKLAKEFRVPLVPFLLEGVAMDPRLNQADGTHPNPEGHRRVAETVWRYLDPVLKGMEK